MDLPTEILSVILSVIKKYYYRGIYRRNEGNTFVFFITNGFTDVKKLPMKDSSTEHFHR